MADYKNFFELNNPLNIYNSSNPLVPVWQSDEYKKKKLQKEDDERWKRLQQRKAAEQTTPFNVEVANNFVNSLLDDLNSGKFNEVSEPRAKDASGNIKPIEGVRTTEDLYNEALLKALYSKDLLTGEYRYPEMLDAVTNMNALNTLDNLEESVNLEKDVTNLVKDFNQFSDTGKSIFSDYKDADLDNVNSYRDLIAELLVERGLFPDEDEAKGYFDSLSEADKSEIALGAIGRKYFRNNPELLNKFIEADNYDRLAMLVSKMKSSPFYQSENEKYKNELDAIYDKDITGPLSRQFEALSQWGQNIQDENKNSDEGNFVTRGALNFFGAATSLTGKILGGIWSLAGEAGKAVHGEWTNDDKELADATVNELDNYFILNEALALADSYIREDFNSKQRRAEQFDALSKLVSPTYKLAMGTDLLKMTDVPENADYEATIDAKLKKLAEIETREKFYGKAAADKSLDEFWKDTTARNQGALDYMMNTAGVGTTSLASDLLAAAAVVTNFVNPYMYSGDENDSGYSDALLKHNIIMDWATGVQKYGEENFHTYKTADEENSFISARDIPDLIGQYGFTLGAKYASMAGSAAVRSASTFAARKALERGVLGAISRGLVADKGLREAIKTGLKAGKGTEEYTKALEAINQIQSKRLYNLNLAVGAAVGTSEGAIEAQQTYEKFKEDNNIDALFDQLKQLIEEASVGQLLEYMKAAGYEPAGFVNDKEGGSKAVYSPEQYAKAKQELLAVNELRRQLANARLEDDALDAAATNFMFNSLINGAANVLLKESLLSDDVKTASRRMKGKTKGLTDLIDVVKGSKGWEARVKDAVKNGNKNIWRSIGTGTKQGAKVAMEAAKTSFGEALEEYGQTISDDVSRAALLADLNNYLETVYDKQSHEAFNTDLLNVLDTGLNALSTSMTSKEALKSGLFGFLSTMGGGINYGGIFTAPVNIYKNRSTADVGTKQWLKDTGKNILNAATNLYDGAVLLAYKESKEDGESARKLAENVNEWLNNPSNLELLTHLGGAIGFKKLLENSLISRDDEAARDDKLGLAVENIFMLRALSGTLMADAYQKSIDDLAALADLTTLEAIPQNFDDLGNYIGEDKQTASAITAFKEQFGQAGDNISDLLILQRVSLNAVEFKELLLKVDNYSKQVEQMYHEDDLDPIVQQAYVLAMIQLDKSRSRRDSLKAKVDGIFDKSNENLTSEDLALIDEKSGLDKATINILAEYGSLGKAAEALQKIKDEINKIEVALTEKPKSGTESELEQQNKSTLKWQEKILKQQKRQLELLIAHVQDAFNRRNEQRKQQQNAVQQVLENKEEGLQESTEATSAPVETSIDEVIPEEVFTVGDIVDMSTQLRSAILSNRNKFSTEQQQEINKFLTLSRKLMAKASLPENSAEQAGDLGLTDEEVIADYVDLAALDSKVSAYDNYLYDYIQNPQFLNIKAQNLKEALRRKTLQFYYKDDLKLKSDETVLDMLDRVNDKINTLKQIGRTEDASILESLVNEQPTLKKMRLALRETEVNLAATIAYNPKWKDKEKEINLALTALRTIISSSGMSLKEIKGVLDALDDDSIARELLKQHKGEFLYNTQLKNAKLEIVLTGNEVADRTALNPIIQTIKDILDEYYNTLEVKEKRGQSLEIETEQPKERTLGLAKAPANQLKSSTKNEADFISVVTPGSTSNPKIANFLSIRKASQALANLANPGKVKFMVTAFCKGTTFVVVPKGKRKNIKGDTSHLFEINGECYQVIGYINNGQSSTIDEIAASTSNTLPNGASRILQDGLGDIQFSINTYGEAKSKSYDSLDPDAAPSLTELLPSETAINGFATGLVQLGEVKPRMVYSDVEEKYVLDGINIEYRGYPVTVKKVETENGTKKAISLFSLPLTGIKLKNGVENPTIAEVLIYATELFNRLKKSKEDLVNLEEGSKEYKDAENSVNSAVVELNQIVKDLKGFKYFETFFNTWLDYKNKYATSETPWEAKAIYNQLIGAFIYLGKSFEGSKGKNLNPLLSEDRQTITINSSDQSSTVSIPIPNALEGNASFTALLALVTIFNNTLGDNPKLEYHNPTLDANVIGSKKTDPVTRIKQNIEIGVVEGLIELEALNGYLPQAMDRDISLMNKFYTLAKGKGANDPNLATPDNSKDESKKPTLEERVERELTEGQKKAKAIVDRIKANSKTVELPDTQSVVTEDDDSDLASYYQGNGTQYARVTSTETAAKGHKKGPVEITGRKKVMSTSHGNTVDTVVRTVFEFLNNSAKTWGKSDAKTLYEEITKNEPFKNGIPNYDKSLSIDFLKQLIEFHNIAQSKGWTIVPDGIKAFGTLNVFNETGKVGTLPTAGTLDLLLYDEEGKFFIVDIKTMHKTSSMNAFKEEREEGWTIQINDYQYLLQQQYHEMEFTGLNYVLSFAVDYKIPGLRVHQGTDRMTILDDSNRPVFTSNGEPLMVKDDSYTEKVLLPIKSELQTQEDVDKYGLDYNKLTEEQRGLVIPFQEESSRSGEVLRGFEFKEKVEAEPLESIQPKIAPAPKKSEENAATVSLEDAAKSRLAGLVGKGKSGGKGVGGRKKKSLRTIKQARFTDFINNHIAPLNEIKVNIFGKIKQKISEFLDTRDTYQKLMVSDLANTFFLGNITQMNSILKGLKVTPANMPKIVERLTTYFETYIRNEDTLIHNVLKRQQSYKALYDYLKGNITEAQFQEELYRLNVEANDMPELIDYINSTDRENERRRIILKLETSTIHTEKDANASIDAIKKRIDNMRTKLEFLSLSSASGMLNRRMESIKNAVGELNISTLEVQTRDSMKKLLNGEDKIYGADNLLSHIARNSKNTFFRLLASTLQSYIRQQNMSITVSLDDLMLNVEGESNGRNITIYKDSLDSYEHLERVLLHEILHSVLLVSPKMKNQLTGIIEKATANIARQSGKTIEEVKKAYYGLTNADEFISEFFTNYAFLEILKTVPQDDGNNTTVSIIEKLIKNFSNKNTVYDQAYKVMKELLRENSLEEMVKTEEVIEDTPYVRHLFKNLKGSIQEMIKLRGITEEEFNNMTAFEQEHLEECCK